MRSCLSKKILPAIAVFGAACGGDAAPFSDDPVGPLDLFDDPCWTERPLYADADREPPARRIV